MQFYTNNTRENIAVSILQAKEWFKAPEGFTVHPFADPFEIVTIAGKPVSRLEGGVFNLLSQVHGKKKDVLKNQIKIHRNGDVTPEMGMCQITGKYHPLRKLKWRRIYNKKLYCVEPKLAGFVWLQDKLQWVSTADARVNLVPYVGEHFKYASSPAWIKKNIKVVKSSIEPNLIMRDESVNLRMDADTNTYISRYEFVAQEHGRYFHCETCGNACHMAMQVTDNQCAACAAATTNRNTGRNGLLNYTHRVERDLGFDDTDCIRIGEIKKTKDGGKTGQPVFLGLEMEFSVPTDFQEATILDIHKARYAQCKSDTSINNGYEIVTKPCSITTHRANLIELFKKHGKVLNPHNSCGLHVHVSRVFNNAEIGRVLQFLNCESNRDFILGMARRKNNAYAKFSDTAISSTRARNGSVDSNGKNTGHVFMSSDRRTALNVKDSTLEFRMFASSNDLETVLASISFCEALFMYAHEVKSLSLNEWLNVKNFIDYINRVEYKGAIIEGKGREKSLRYPELISYIAKHKLVTESKNMYEVRLGKIIDTFANRINPVPKHMELPKTIAREIADNLSKNSGLMRIWMEDPSNVVMWQNEAWQLLDHRGKVILTHAAA